MSTVVPTVSEPPTPTRPAYREGQYLRYIAGQSASVLGDQVWYVALAWAAVQLASPAVAGIIMTVSSIPRLVLMLLGGVAVDRFGPKRLMIHSDLLRAAVLVVAAVIALSAPSIGLLVTVAVIFGAVSAVFMPAAGAMAPLLLHKSQLSSGVALRELTSRAAMTLGAPLGGALVAFGGLPLAAAVDAVALLLSALALASLRPREVVAERKPDAVGLAAVKAGLSYLRHHRLLRNIIVVGLLSNLGFVGPMNIGLALVADARGWGAVGIGALLSGFGIGAAATALILLRLKPRRGLGPMVAGCALLQGAALFAIVVAPQLWMAVAATVVTGISGGLMGVLLGSLSQANTDDAFRGRVSSVSMMVNLGISPLAVAGTGIAVGVFGLTATFAASCGLSVLAAVICLGSRELRHSRLD